MHIQPTNAFTNGVTPSPTPLWYVPRTTANTIQDDHGLTPLALALITGCKEAAARLASRGADVGTADKQGVAPAHRAAGHGDLDALELLAGNGADFETQSGSGTPLHWAAGEVRPTGGGRGGGSEKYGESGVATRAWEARK